MAVNRAEKWDTLEILIDKGNKEVTVVEMLKKMGKDIGSTTRWTILGELKRLGVGIITGAKAVEVKEQGLEIEKGGSLKQLQADSIVIATGSEPEDGLKKEIEDMVGELHIIGDARESRKAIDAIKEGFLTGLKI